VPSLVTWDDHEVQNDYADQYSQYFDDPAQFLIRRAAAYQAFYEHMPRCGRSCRIPTVR
jgi:alkaline phosphatase D